MDDVQQYASRVVGAQLMIGQVPVPLNGFSLIHAIDQFPSGQAILQLDNRNDKEAIGSVQLRPERFAKLYKLLQDKILLNTRLDADSYLEVIDGNGVRIRFPCFIGQPQFTLYEGQLEMSVALTHSKIAVQAFNPQIYNTFGFYISPFTELMFGKKASPESQAALRSDSVALKCLAMLKYMVEHPYLEETPLKPNEYDGLPIHLMNVRAFHLVETILKDSAKTTEIKGLGDENFDIENLARILWNLFLNAGPFVNVLPALCEIFMFQMNSDFQGHLWLEHLQFLEEPNHRIIQVPMVDLNFTCAHAYTLPVLQVIVVAEDNEFYVYSGALGTNLGAAPLKPQVIHGGEVLAGVLLANDGTSWVRSHALAKFPEEITREAEGNFFIVPAPSWISPSLLTNDYVSATTLKDPEKPRTEAEVKAREIAAEKFKAFEVPKLEILKHMAFMNYQQLQLGGTSARIVIPLDFRPCPGRTYWVTGMDEAPLFIGFLREVHHNVGLTPSNGVAVTTLSFSHIRTADSHLPFDTTKLSSILSTKTPTILSTRLPATDKTFKPPPSS